MLGSIIATFKHIDSIKRNETNVFYIQLINDNISYFHIVIGVVK
jgi:hypothetical protein